MKRKVVVIGLDGATWKLLDKVKLKNIEALKSKGAYGVLESTIPPVTGPAWTSFTTGKKPGNHGIMDFLLFDNRSHNMRIALSKDIQGETLYEAVDSVGGKSIIINLPLSYPPKNFEGVICADFLSPKPYIRPKSLEKYIKRYRLVADTTKTGEELVEDILDVETHRTELAKKLFREQEWDFFFVLISGTDTMSHEFYIDMLDETPLGKKGREIFQLADAFIGWVMDNIDDETVLIVMSDHGFAKYSGVFYINEWLASKGYLTKSKKESEHGEFSEKLGRKGKKKVTLPSFVLRAARLPLVNKVARTVYERWLKKGYHIISKETIDFEKSTAFVPTPQSFGVYINSKERFEKGTIGAKEYDEVFDKLVAELKTIKLKNGRRLFNKVIDNRGNHGPDILFVPNEVYVSNGLGVNYEERKIGWHSPEGIWMAFGNNVRKSGRLETRDIYDLMPSILGYLGVETLKGIDGKPIKGLLKPPEKMEKRVAKGPSEKKKERVTSEEEVKERLRSLGYL